MLYMGNSSLQVRHLFLSLCSRLELKGDLEHQSSKNVPQTLNRYVFTRHLNLIHMSCRNIPLERFPMSTHIIWECVLVCIFNFIKNRV